MIYVVYVIHIITCIFLILVVLLQQGKGADLSVFGGGTTQAAFGARGAATLLHKLTVAFFVLFMITTVSIGILQRGRRASSVMQGVEAPEPAAPATAPTVPTAAAPQVPATQGASAPATQDSAAPATEGASAPAAEPVSPETAAPPAPADGAAPPQAETQPPPGN